MNLTFGTDCIEASSLANAILDRHLDPMDIWNAVGSIRPFAASDLRASCEVVFARIAIIKFMVKRSKDPAFRSQAFAELDEMVTREFRTERGAAEELFGKCLSKAAAETIALYYGSASVPALVAASLLERVQATSPDQDACEDMLQRFADELTLTLPNLKTVT